jgi:hypothetical protein
MDCVENSISDKGLDPEAEKAPNEKKQKRMKLSRLVPAWRIRDVYPGSDFFPSRIRTVSIPDPGSASKNLSVFLTQKNGF